MPSRRRSGSSTPPKRATKRSSARRTPPGAVYQLELTLRGIRPPIWRRLLVPGDITLGRLHAVFQVAMGWEESHLHVFRIEGKKYSDPEFDLDEDGIGDEHAVTLAEVTHGGEAGIVYEYDFGDSWEHDVKVEKVYAPGESSARGPVCLAGARACPPEDVGGTPGYEEFLRAIADPEHGDHAHYLEWVGGEFDPETLDLEKINRALRDPESSARD